jgi:hypothetical protein
LKCEWEFAAPNSVSGPIRNGTLATSHKIKQICYSYCFDKENFGMRGLNLDQLRALLKVVKHGSFSAAARRLDSTPPAVTLKTRETERRFGLQRSSGLKQAHATVPGRNSSRQRSVFSTSATKSMQQCGDFARVDGRVRLSMTLTSMVYRLPPILRKIRLDHPGIDRSSRIRQRRPALKTSYITDRSALVNLPIQKKQPKTTALRRKCRDISNGTRDIPNDYAQRCWGSPICW